MTGAQEAAQKLNHRIRHELRRFPRDKVDAFVRSVGAALGAHDIYRLYMDGTKRRAELKRLYEATETYLRAIRVPVVLTFPERLDRDEQPSEHELAEREAFYRAMQAAESRATNFLAEIENVLSHASARPRGRPKADGLGLLATVASRYWVLFGELPTSTPGGTFSNIAVLVLENARGEMPADVSRQIRPALIALRRKSHRHT